MEGKCGVIRFNPKTDKYELLGPVVAGEDHCWQIRDIAVTPDGTIYTCENDNPFRSSLFVGDYTMSVAPPPSPRQLTMDD
jgi:hypothetical protein